MVADSRGAFVQIDWSVGIVLARTVGNTRDDFDAHQRWVGDLTRRRLDVSPRVCVVDRHGFSRLPAQRSACPLVLPGVEVVRAAAIVHVALVVPRRKRDLAGQGSPAGQVKVGDRSQLLTLTQTDGLAQTKLTGRRLADDIDGATRGIASVERALGAAQHLDALHIGEIEDQCLWSCVVDAVLVDSDRPILGDLHRIIVALTTHVQGQHGIRAGVRCHIYRRRLCNQCGQGCDAAPIHLLTGERRNGNRGFLQILRSLLGSHEDFLDDATGFRAGACRLCLRVVDRQENRRDDTQQYPEMIWITHEPLLFERHHDRAGSGFDDDAPAGIRVSWTEHTRSNISTPVARDLTPTD